MAPFSVTKSVKEQLRKPPAVVRTSLKNKTVLLVGANTGLGYEACKHFAGMRPLRLIMACRSQERGQAAVDKLKKETGFTNVELRIVDLASFQSVCDFATKMEEEDARLDLVVLNAALASYEYRTTAEGWEQSLQVNNLGTSLLALLLLPQMLKTHQRFGVTPRLVIVASDVHFETSLDETVLRSPHGILAKLNEKEYCSTSVMNRRYKDTKLLNVLFARKLASLFRPLDSPIIVNSVNPGFCYSELRRNMSGILAAGHYVAEKIMAFTTEEGSRQLVWAAIGGVDEEVQGEYISLSKVAEPSDFVLSETGKAVQERVWKEQLEILEKVDSRVSKVVNELKA